MSRGTYRDNKGHECNGKTELNFETSTTISVLHIYRIHYEVMIHAACYNTL